MRISLVLLALVLMASNPVSAISLGQIDDFEGETTMGWMAGPGGAMGPMMPPNPVGNPFPPIIQDGQLKLSAIGNPAGDLIQPGGRLRAFNIFGQWAGDYNAAGVTDISMDFYNVSPVDLYMRIEVGSLGPMGLSGAFFSKDPILVPAGQRVTGIFSLAAEDMIDLFQGNGNTLEQVLGGNGLLSLFHNPTGGPGGGPPNAGNPNLPPFVTAMLLVDNITALPEPHLLVFVGMGLGALALRRRSA